MQTSRQFRTKAIVKELYVGLIGWLWIVAGVVTVYFAVIALIFGGSWWNCLGSGVIAWFLYRVSLFYVLEKQRELLATPRTEAQRSTREGHDAAVAQFSRRLAGKENAGYATPVSLREAAEQGDAASQAAIGMMYATGQGVPQDDAQAVAWYRKAADQGYALAQRNMGVMYDSGKGVPQDDAQAVAWYRKAADQGYAAAQLDLGFRYAKGQGVPQDDAQAVAWYRKAADQGDAIAQCNLGVMYANGRGVPQDDAEAVSWYRKAAEQGHAARKPPSD